MAKVLIVEDDPLMSRMYQKTFSFAGYSIVMAVDGEEGVLKASTESPDIILLDIMMPKMNGIQALEKLKADPKTKNIPVVMLTNMAESKTAEESLTKGAAKYVIKSEYDPGQVVAMVEQLLKNNPIIQ